jgi:hypothetical protein
VRAQDVLVTLLNNLKVQERQNRVCTTVAIAIVAETCSPFTVLPALMNEYKVRPGCTQLPAPRAEHLRTCVVRNLCNSSGPLRLGLACCACPLAYV